MSNYYPVVLVHGLLGFGPKELEPFFGGVPATAAIARTSIGIKSGGQMRLVSIIHALALLASMFLLAPAHRPDYSSRPSNRLPSPGVALTRIDNR